MSQVLQQYPAGVPTLNSRNKFIVYGGELNIISTVFTGKLEAEIEYDSLMSLREKSINLMDWRIQLNRSVDNGDGFVLEADNIYFSQLNISGIDIT